MELSAKEEYEYFKVNITDLDKHTSRTKEESLQWMIDHPERLTKKKVKMATRYLKELNAEAEKQAERKALLEPYDSPDDAKEASKKLTKISNKFGDRAYKEGESFKDLAWEANKDFSYGDQSEMAKAVWSFVSFDRFAPRMVTNVPANLEKIKEPYPALYKEASVSWDRLKEDAEFIAKLTNHINEEKARFKGTTAQQFLDLASRSNELSREKQEAYRAYSMSLKGWKPAEIKDGTIYVNGKPYDDGIVGVMIGRGCRVHMMRLEIGTRKDEETGIEEEVIWIRNHTQWRNSPLVILDMIDNIPAELYSERH